MRAVERKAPSRVEPRRETKGKIPSEAAWLSWYMCALSLALAAGGLLLLVLSREARPGIPVFAQWAEDAVIAIGFSTLGAVVAPRFPPKNPIGWLFCSLGLVAAVLLFGGEYAYYSLLAQPGSLPGGEAFSWIARWIWVPSIGLFLFLGLLFPDGRLPTPRWRPFAWLVAAVVVLGIGAVALSPGPIGGIDSLHNPLSVEGAPNLVDPVEVVVYALGFPVTASLLARMRHASGVERQQIKWFAYAAVILVCSATLTYVVSEATSMWWLRWEVGFVTTIVGFVGLPVALGIAILRYRLHDIDLVINLTLVYGALTALLAGIFEVNVVALQHLVLALSHENDSQLSYFASALVMAALFEPLRRRIDTFVERRFFRGDNDTATFREASRIEPRNGEDLDTASEVWPKVEQRTIQTAYGEAWVHCEIIPQDDGGVRPVALNETVVSTDD